MNNHQNHQFKMDRNRLRTLLNCFILIWMLINLNTLVNGGDGSSDSIVEFRPQGKFSFLGFLQFAINFWILILSKFKKKCLIVVN